MGKKSLEEIPIESALSGQEPNADLESEDFMSNIPTKLSLSSPLGKAEVTNSQDFDKDINLQPTFEHTEEITDDIGFDQYQFKDDELHNYPDTNIQQLQPQFISKCDDEKREKG